MNVSAILIGIFLLVWGSLYQKMMKFWIYSKTGEDYRLKAEGKILDVFEEDNQFFFHIEVELNSLKQIIKVPFYEEKDKAAVGNLVYLLIDENNLENCEIDWHREMTLNQARHIKKAVKFPSYALMFTGLILIIKGLDIF